MQRVGGFVEAFDLVHMRCADEPAAQAVGPCVVGALNHAEMAGRFFAQPRSTMPADIIKSAHFTMLIPHKDQAFTGSLFDEIITGRCQLALMADAEPLSGKNPPLFRGENLRRDEILLRQRFGAGSE